MVIVDSVASVLSAQQQAALALSATGLLSAEVATALGTPVDEVRAHLATAVVAIGARSKLEAVIIALRRGLIDLPPAQRNSGGPESPDLPVPPRS